MNAQDRAFFRNFLAVLGVLVLLAILIGIYASNMVSSDDEAGGMDSRASAMIAERIAPVGKVAVGEPPKDAAAGDGKPKAPRGGAEVVATYCAGCHGAGVPGAPQIGKKGDWTSRIQAAGGVDAMSTKAYIGFGAMPPKGASDASESEFLAAVQDMLKKSGL